MKSDPIALGQLFYHRNRFAVPIYQRHYVWTRQKQWEPLWLDIRSKALERLEGRPNRFAHFMGAIVLEGSSGFTTRKVPVLYVIDGQQRLTTIQVFLAALRDTAVEAGCEGVADDLERYLFNPDQHLMEEREIEVFKLWPTRFDREHFCDILQFKSRIEIRNKYIKYFYKTKDAVYQYSTTPKLLWSYIFFSDCIREFLSDEEDVPSEISAEERLMLIWQALLEDFKVVEIRLDKGDDAQVIFETLNERGEPLMAADLVRNFVFYRLPGTEKEREKHFEKHWRPFEQRFWSEDERQGRFKKPRLEFFLANFLSAKTARETNIGKLYSEYKHFVERGAYQNVLEELTDLGTFRPLYQQLVSQDSETYLGKFGRRLAPWDVTTINPLVLRIAAERELTHAKKESMLHDLLSFVGRRAICGLTTKNYNKYFLQVLRQLEERGFNRDVLQEFMLGQQAETTVWPSDKVFKRSWFHEGVYQTLRAARTRAVLEELEVAIRSKFNEDIEIKSALSVEHIMPVRWEKSWPLADGTYLEEDAFSFEFFSDDDERTQEVTRREIVKHTIGNLTLLTQPLNSRVSNGPFEKKRKAIAKQSSLALNRHFQTVTSWDEVAILRRSEELFNLARKIWSRPTN